jgi:hypothetical protein
MNPVLLSIGTLVRDDLAVLTPAVERVHVAPESFRHRFEQVHVLLRIEHQRLLSP